MERYALKFDEDFLVADALGDITGDGDGLFHNDTRLLSRFNLSIGGAAPSLLSSGVSQDNVFFRANVTNRPLPQLGGSTTPEGVIHVERARLLWGGRLYERLTLTNYGEHDVPAPLHFAFASDFADIFEVRGHTRLTRGRVLPPQLDGAAVIFAYEGLDGVVRSCVIAFSQRPDRLARDSAEFTLALRRHTSLRVYLEIGAEAASAPDGSRFRQAAAQARIAMRRKRRRGASVHCPRGPFQTWLLKSRADLALLTTDMPTGPYPFAGIPWFSTPFGRDGIVTALEVLWLDASLARGVLRFLAESQAHGASAFDDAAPGKILHETRKGELAAIREVPFARYYGGVDTTPLFVMLAGAYARRTGDLAFVDRLWPSLEAAMAWIDGSSDSNRDGFVYYARTSRIGLVNQGWKDSTDSIFHDGRRNGGAAGRAGRGPGLRLCSAALDGLARRTPWGRPSRAGVAAAGEGAARRGRKALLAFRPRLSTPSPSTARDGPAACGPPTPGICSTRGCPRHRARGASSSNCYRRLSITAGDCARSPATSHASIRCRITTARSGRTTPRICAAGMAAYGHRDAAATLLSASFEAAMHFEMRLPELYCGFVRRPGEPPVGYPVACLPQAWSSGAAFMMLQACLGVAIDGLAGVLRIDRPELPRGVEHLALRGVAVGNAQVDVAFERFGDRVMAAPIGAVPPSVEIVVRA